MNPKKSNESKCKQDWPFLKDTLGLPLDDLDKPLAELILRRLDEISARLAELDAQKHVRRGSVLTAEEAAQELRCSTDHLRRYYVRKKLLIPLPRKSPGDGKGKRGGRLKFRAEDVARLNGQHW